MFPHSDAERMRNSGGELPDNIKLQNKNNESLNDPLITLSLSSLDDKYPLDQPLIVFL